MILLSLSELEAIKRNYVDILAYGNEYHVYFNNSEIVISLYKKPHWLRSSNYRGTISFDGEIENTIENAEQVYNFVNNLYITEQRQKQIALAEKAKEEMKAAREAIFK